MRSEYCAPKGYWDITYNRLCHTNCLHRHLQFIGSRLPYTDSVYCIFAGTEVKSYSKKSMIILLISVFGQ